MFLDAVVMQDGLQYTCGGLGLNVPSSIPYLVHAAVTIIKIVVPILLIIFGMLDLGKAVIASKEDEIKKGQTTFIKRIIAAVIVFFVIQIVQIVIGFVSSKDPTVMNCVNCFVNGTVGETGCETVD